jgi:hypothetical protein
MRRYIKISLDDDNGDANLTPSSNAFIEEMTGRGDLLDYDQLSDMFHIFREAFEQVHGAYYPNDKMEIRVHFPDPEETEND